MFSALHAAITINFAVLEAIKYIFTPLRDTYPGFKPKVIEVLQRSEVRMFSIYLITFFNKDGTPGLFAR